MLKQFNLSLYFLLCVLFLLSACSNTGESPAIVVVEVSATPVNTVQPTATSLPTSTPTPENPVVIIAPPPLPTTIPDQQTRLAEAKENRVESVDFVIDTAELEEWRSPTFRVSGDFWYKHTSSDGRFSILMHGLHPPEEENVDAVIENTPLIINRMQTDYFMGGSIHSVEYFDAPSLIDGELTAQEYLDKFLSTYLERVINNSDSKVTPEVVNAIVIQMDSHPGRDYLLTLQVEGSTFPLRLRAYVVGSTVYLLSVTGIFEDEVLGENADRFLDSFTLNETREGE